MDLIGTTARNLREVSPTLYFNVPRGYDLVLPLLESDEALRRSFFSTLDAMFYAGAALPQNLYDRLRALVPAERAGRTVMLSGWGSTETAPLSTIVHFPIDRPANVGIPAPGIELKLLPSGSKLEVRVRGPNVTPGYYRNDELTRAAFDEEGFYKIGDAMRLFDPGDAAKGLVLHANVAASSMAPRRLLVLEHPPSIDAGEITDKGYINQRAVLEHRALHVDHLHAGGPGVVTL